jgi:hypothetical protein
MPRARTFGFGLILGFGARLRLACGFRGDIGRLIRPKVAAEVVGSVRRDLWDPRRRPT